MKKLSYKGRIDINKDTLFVFFDVETAEREDRTFEIVSIGYISYFFNTDTEVERKVLVNAKYCDLKEIPPYVEVLENEDEIREKFTDYLIMMTSFFSNVIVVSHNLHFDRIAVDFYKLAQFFTIEYYNFEQNMFINYKRRFLNHVRHLIFNDNMNYFTTSIKALGKIFGIEKEEVETYERVDEKHIEYLMRDVEILMKSHLFVVKSIIDEVSMPKYYLTISALSFSLFLNKYSDYEITLHNIEDVMLLERASYRGGRNEARVVGIVNEKIYKLDVNSQYPYQMLTHNFPVKLIAYYDYVEGRKAFFATHKKRDGSKESSYVYLPLSKEDDWKEILKQLQDRKDLVYIVDGIFDIQDDVIGVRAYIEKSPPELSRDTLESKIVPVDPYDYDDKDTSLVFVKGEDIHTVLTSAELEKFRDKIKVKDVFRISVYETKPIFRRFITKVYGKRVMAKVNENKPMDLFYKLVMNTLTGKFSQKHKIRYPVDNEYVDIPETISVGKIYDVSTGKVYENVFGHFFEVVGEITSPNTFIAISSFITAYGRNYLTHLIKLVEENGGKVFYYDTDSIHVDEKGYQILKTNGYIAKRFEIGKLKNEGIYDAGIYITNKQYVLLKDAGDGKYTVEITFSGVPLKTVLQYLHDKGIVFNDVGVDDYDDYFRVHREIDFPVYTTPESCTSCLTRYLTTSLEW